MQDFFFAANPTNTSHSMLLPADIESALRDGKSFLKRKKPAEAEAAYWQGFDQAVLDETSHHLRTMLGESQGVIAQAQSLTKELLLDLGYLYEDLGEYEYAACCYKKAMTDDSYVWQRYHDMTDYHDAHYSEAAWARLIERVSLLNSQAPPIPEPIVETRKKPALTPESPAVYNAA